MAKGIITREDPQAADARALVERHRRFAHLHTPVERSYALDVDGLLDPAITFFGFRESGQLLAIGALKRLDEHSIELKSMHTAEEARRRGIGRAMLAHLVAVAREQGFGRIDLETGSTPAYEAARRLYQSFGFKFREPFGDYVATEFNTFMSLDLVTEPATP